MCCQKNVPGCGDLTLGHPHYYTCTAPTVEQITESMRQLANRLTKMTGRVARPNACRIRDLPHSQYSDLQHAAEACKNNPECGYIFKPSWSYGIHGKAYHAWDYHLMSNRKDCEICPMAGFDMGNELFYFELKPAIDTFNDDGNQAIRSLDKCSRDSMNSKIYDSNEILIKSYYGTETTFLESCGWNGAGCGQRYGVQTNKKAEVSDKTAVWKIQPAQTTEYNPCEEAENAGVHDHSTYVSFEADATDEDETGAPGKIQHGFFPIYHTLDYTREVAGRSVRLVDSNGNRVSHGEGFLQMRLDTDQTNWRYVELEGNTNEERTKIASIACAEMSRDWLFGTYVHRMRKYTRMFRKLDCSAIEVGRHKLHNCERPYALQWRHYVAKIKCHEGIPTMTPTTMEPTTRHPTPIQCEMYRWGGRTDSCDWFDKDQPGYRVLNDRTREQCFRACKYSENCHFVAIKGNKCRLFKTCYSKHTDSNGDHTLYKKRCDVQSLKTMPHGIHQDDMFFRGMVDNVDVTCPVDENHCVTSRGYMGGGYRAHDRCRITFLNGAYIRAEPEMQIHRSDALTFPSGRVTRPENVPDRIEEGQWIDWKVGSRSRGIQGWKLCFSREPFQNEEQEVPPPIALPLNLATFENPPESQRSYKSTWGRRSDMNSMIDSNSGWIAGRKRRGEWMIIDLGRLAVIAGVVTQTRKNHFQHVTKFTLKHSHDCFTYYDVDGSRAFEDTTRTCPKGANCNTFNFYNGDDKLKFGFNNPVRARCIQFIVQEYMGHPAMRAGLLIGNDDQVPGGVSDIPDIDLTPYTYELKRSGKYCRNWHPLPWNGAYTAEPPRIHEPKLHSAHRLASTDKVRECMNRCLDAHNKGIPNIGNQAFSIYNDNYCICAQDSCNYYRNDYRFDSYRINSASSGRRLMDMGDERRNLQHANQEEVGQKNQCYICHQKFVPDGNNRAGVQLSASNMPLENVAGWFQNVTDAGNRRANLYRSCQRYRLPEPQPDNTKCIEYGQAVYLENQYTNPHDGVGGAKTFLDTCGSNLRIDSAQVVMGVGLHFNKDRSTDPRALWVIEGGAGCVRENQPVVLKSLTQNPMFPSYGFLNTFGTADCGGVEKGYKIEVNSEKAADRMSGLWHIQRVHTGQDTRDRRELSEMSFPSQPIDLANITKTFDGSSDEN